MLDTGADKSLISNKTMRTVPKDQILQSHKPQIRLRGVTGHDLKILKTVVIKFKFGQKLLQHTFHVTQGLQHAFIMGRDFLTTNKAKIDFENKTIAVGKQVVLLSKDEKQACDINIIHAANKTILEPRTINYIHLKAQNTIKQNCLVTPLENCELFSDQPGLLSSRVLTKNSKTIILPVYNETSKRFTISKGSKIAYLEKIDENELKNENTKTTAEINLTTHKTSPNDDNKQPSVKIGQQLNDKTQKQIDELLTKHNKLFAKDDKDLGSTHLTEVSLDTGDHPPIKQRPYRLPYSQWPMLENHLNDLQKANIIKPSQSPWASPILFVPRKDGGQPRMCVDYRKLNKALVQNSYPLPNIQDLLASFKGAQVYSVLDLKSGYYQIPLDPKDRQKTAFICPFGLFEFNKLPFGLSTAPSWFQELMHKVLGDSLYVYALVYLDDIIIFSNNHDEHIQHLNTVFDKLSAAGLKLKASKTHLFQKEVDYLGHIVSGDGIRPDPSKVSAIKNMHPPTTVKDVRSFVGMASYYRSFIEDFSKVVQPITELTRKHVKFKWTAERQQAFETLKEKLSTAPVLAHPKLSEPYNLYTDSSGYAVGAVLTQVINGQERPIQYLSKQLAGGQRKWPTIEREAYAIIFAVSKLRHFLYGSKFTVFCDHKPLRTLFTSEMKNCRVQRWAIMLEEYGADMQYKSGKSNIQADFLSRIRSPSEESTEEMDINVVDTSTLERPHFKRMYPRDDVIANDINAPLDMLACLKQSQSQDPECKAILDALSKEENKNNEFVIDDDILYHVATPVRYDMTHRLQLVLPKSMRQEVLEQAHESAFGGGHTGFDKTNDKVRRRFYWKTQYKDTADFVLKCKLCNARNMRKARIPMQDMPIPNYPFELIGIDTSGPFVEAEDGSTYMITIIDHLSGWPECYATKDKSAATVARLLLEDFIPRHTCPRVILSDNGTEFVNAVVGLLLSKLKIAHIKTAVAHPATNAKVERFHAFANNAIAKYAYQNQRTWPKYIPALVMAYRTAVHDSTLFSPFYLVYGRDPVLPMDTLLNPKYKYMGEEYVPSMLERLHIAYKEVQENSYEARENNRERLAKRASLQEFNVGDAVYYFDRTTKDGECPKFTMKWRPFYRVIQRMGPVTYQIVDTTTGKQRVVHTEALRPAHPEHVWDVQRETPEHIITDEEQEEVSRKQPVRQAKLAGLTDEDLATGSGLLDVPIPDDLQLPEALINTPGVDHRHASDEDNNTQGTKRAHLSDSESDGDDMQCDDAVHGYNLRRRKTRRHDPDFVYGEVNGFFSNLHITLQECFEERERLRQQIKKASKSLENVNDQINNLKEEFEISDECLMEFEKDQEDTGTYA